jgi:hypothetical protein
MLTSGFQFHYSQFSILNSKAMAKTPKNTTASKKTVEALTHEEAKRKNIPTAEYHSVLQKAEQDPVRVAYKRHAQGAGIGSADTGDPLLCAHRFDGL